MSSLFLTRVRVYVGVCWTHTHTHTAHGLREPRGRDETLGGPQKADGPRLNLGKYVFVCVQSSLTLQAPPNLHPFALEGLVRTKTFLTLLLGVAYSVSKSESLSSSEVANTTITDRKPINRPYTCPSFDVSVTPQKHAVL